MGEAKCSISLDALLSRRAKTFRFAPGCNARRHSGKGRADHSEHVRVEAMSVHKANLTLIQETNKATKLFDCVRVVEARERVLRNVAQAQPFDFAPQNAPRIEASKFNVKTSVLFQLAHELYGLALSASLIKAVYDVENCWFQD